jgi:flagellar basal-body rod protein FlgB
MFQGVASNIEHYMSLLSERQKLVASNIANADTPGYGTQDIEFRTEYDQQLSPTPHVIQPDGLAIKPDGNNVNLDRETRLLSENALRFAVASNMASSELHQMRSAIDGGGSSS